MKSIRKIFVNSLLVVGAFTTMATSLQDAYLDEKREFELATSQHITLTMDEEVATDSDNINLIVAAQVQGDAHYSIRIVPDNAMIPVVEVDTDVSLSHSFDQLQQYCELDAPCTLGFTVEILSGEAPLPMEFFASARKFDQGGSCNRPPTNFSTNAKIELTLDSE